MAVTSDIVSPLDSLPGVVTIYGYKNVNLIVWDGPANVEAVEVLGRVTARRRRTHPEGLSAVHVVRTQITMPDAEVREAIVKLMKQVEGVVGAIAFVVGGGGFWASSLRSLITGMKMLSRSSFELRLHGGLDEAAAWLPAAHMKRTGVQLESNDLLAALNQITRL